MEATFKYEKDTQKFKRIIVGHRGGINGYIYVPKTLGDELPKTITLVKEED